MSSFYSDSELEIIFKGNKEMIDSAYESTKNKHGALTANTAILNYFLNGYTRNFTRDNNARSNMNNFLYHPNEFYQILLDYAISSCMINAGEFNISLDEIRSYANPENSGLNYDPMHITKVVALATAWSPYWTVNMLSCNSIAKEALVRNFVTERYAQNKKEALDNSKRVKLVKLSDGKTLTISKNSLNRNIDNMNSDEEIEYATHKR